MEANIPFDISSLLYDKLSSMTKRQLSKFDYYSFDHSAYYPSLSSLNNISVQDFNLWSKILGEDSDIRICFDETPDNEMKEKFHKLAGIYLEQEGKTISDLKSPDVAKAMIGKFLLQFFVAYKEYKLSSIVAFMYIEIQAMIAESKAAKKN